jgi:hypothetical protein
MTKAVVRGGRVGAAPAHGAGVRDSGRLREDRGDAGRASEGGTGRSMFSLFIENFVLALINRYPVPPFIAVVVYLLNPLYEWLINHGL